MQTAQRLTKIDGATYSVWGDLYVVKMDDGSWTAFKAVDGDLILWAWSSPKHFTRRSAVSSARFHLRRTMAAHKNAQHLREQAAARETTPQPIPAIVHILPAWATEALCGARPGPQPDDAVPNCRRCLAQLTGE